MEMSSRGVVVTIVDIGALWAAAPRRIYLSQLLILFLRSHDIMTKRNASSLAGWHPQNGCDRDLRVCPSWLLCCRALG